MSGLTPPRRAVSRVSPLEVVVGRSPGWWSRHWRRHARTL